MIDSLVQSLYVFTDLLNLGSVYELFSYFLELKLLFEAIAVVTHTAMPYHRADTQQLLF